MKHSDAPGFPPCNTGHQQILLACRIAALYRNRIPTWRELVASFGLSRATAYRWVHAMKLARGIEPDQRSRAA